MALYAYAWLTDDGIPLDSKVRILTILGCDGVYTHPADRTDAHGGWYDLLERLTSEDDVLFIPAGPLTDEDVDARVAEAKRRCGRAFIVAEPAPYTDRASRPVVGEAGEDA